MSSVIRFVGKGWNHLFLLIHNNIGYVVVVDSENKVHYDYCPCCAGGYQTAARDLDRAINFAIGSGEMAKAVWVLSKGMDRPEHWYRDHYKNFEIVDPSAFTPPVPNSLILEAVSLLR